MTYNTVKCVGLTKQGVDLWRTRFREYDVQYSQMCWSYRTLPSMNDMSIHFLIEQLESLQVCFAHLKKAEPEPRTDSTTVAAVSPSFERGHRVWIKNKLKKPATWANEVAWNEDEAKTATVSHNARVKCTLLQIMVLRPGERSTTTLNESNSWLQRCKWGLC